MTDRVAEQLVAAVEAAADRWKRLDEEAASRRPAPGKWSPKELVGHLIDSATNNHHRFVRAQQTDSFSFPKYEQEDWVRLQQPNERRWEDLVALWQAYNHHLAHVIRQIPAEKLAVVCRIGPYDPVTLGYIVEDYLAHLQHHVRQVDEGSVR